VTPAGRVTVRAVRPADWPWLVAVGLDPEKIGRQYHWTETPLQLWCAPGRALLARRRPAAIIEVDGRRAGYVGTNPLSGNLEYFLQPWARGRGAGPVAIAEFLAGHRAGDRARRFVVSHANPRSLAALRRAFERLGWREGSDYRVVAGRRSTSVWVRPEASTSTA
jgi:hypothetical protein